MVCDRCIMMVKYQLLSIGIIPMEVQLGEVSLKKTLSTKEIDTIGKALIPLGFEILIDRKYQLIEKIKNVVIKFLYYDGEKMKVNLSDFISQKLTKEYAYLSNLFSEVEGITIEKYFILQKTARIKELLVYNELTLKEIAYKLDYSSVSHLSSQFKKVTGLSPTLFKEIKKNKRTTLDKLENVYHNQEII
jgi:AraC-like DNA-binding protein